jgi:hypothetical protein
MNHSAPACASVIRDHRFKPVREDGGGRARAQPRELTKRPEAPIGPETGAMRTIDPDGSDYRLAVSADGSVLFCNRLDPDSNRAMVAGLAPPGAGRLLAALLEVLRTVLRALGSTFFREGSPRRPGFLGRRATTSNTRWPGPGCAGMRGGSVCSMSLMTISGSCTSSPSAALGRSPRLDDTPTS